MSKQPFYVSVNIYSNSCISFSCTDLSSVLSLKCSALCKFMQCDPGRVFWPVLATAMRIVESEVLPSLSVRLSVTLMICSQYSHIDWANSKVITQITSLGISLGPSLLGAPHGDLVQGEHPKFHAGEIGVSGCFFSRKPAVSLIMTEVTIHH